MEDGQQRLTAIFEFFSDDLPLSTETRVCSVAPCKRARPSQMPSMISISNTT